MRLDAFGAVITIIVGLGGSGSFVWAMSHIKGMQLTLELVQVGNRELRAELQHEREERHRERLDCAKEIAQMEGRVQLLTDGIGDQIASATVDALLRAQKSTPPASGM